MSYVEIFSKATHDLSFPRVAYIALENYKFYVQRFNFAIYSMDAIVIWHAEKLNKKAMFCVLFSAKVNNVVGTSPISSYMPTFKLNYIKFFAIPLGVILLCM